jgi:hypothetical protein
MDLASTLVNETAPGADGAVRGVAVIVVEDAPVPAAFTAEALN